jgi:phosphoribosylaminoimidazole-succinocarboxamide synthase
MGIDITLIRDLCDRTLDDTHFEGLGEKHTGKVRDSYVKDGQRTIVVSDRISAFDVVLGTIPLKGQVLNQLAAFWFEATRDIAPNHLLSVPDPNVSIVKECKLLPVEFVMRGYLTGSTSTSIWTAYERGDRSYCGHTLKDGMKRHEKLPEPLLTPTTKADMGFHDEVSSRDALIAAGTISEEHYARAEALSAALFAAGQRHAASCGLILVDTKYEIGLDENDELVVIDEVHTPDSSRYWYADRYVQAMSLGRNPEAIDKEYLRLWLGEQGYKGEGAPPDIPDSVRCESARRYIEAFEQVTGRSFEPNTEEPVARIERSLGLAS